MNDDEILAIKIAGDLAVEMVKHQLSEQGGFHQGRIAIQAATMAVDIVRRVKAASTTPNNEEETK
jgi:hypothetical protein